MFTFSKSRPNQEIQV